MSRNKSSSERQTQCFSMRFSEPSDKLGGRNSRMDSSEQELMLSKPSDFCQRNMDDQWTYRLMSQGKEKTDRKRQLFFFFSYFSNIYETKMFCDVGNKFYLHKIIFLFCYSYLSLDNNFFQTISQKNFPVILFFTFYELFPLSLYLFFVSYYFLSRVL